MLLLPSLMQTERRQQGDHHRLLRDEQLPGDDYCLFIWDLFDKIVARLWSLGEPMGRAEAEAKARAS